MTKKKKKPNPTVHAAADSAQAAARSASKRRVESTQREWGASGIGTGVVARLGPDRRKQIEAVVKGRNIKAGDPEGFFGRLAYAIGYFDMFRRLKEASRPAAVRSILKRARMAALKLNDRLNELDGNSRQLLREVVQDGILVVQGVKLADIILALNRAEPLASQYQASEYRKAGRLPEHHRLFLAADVAHIVETDLGVKPTIAKDGLYVAVLEAVLAEATGKIDATVQQLAKRVLSSNVRRQLPDGVIEYVPPGPN